MAASSKLTGARPHVLVLATADWDAPLWTNKQYIAVELAREFRVTYVESLGLRKVRPSLPDLRRVLRRAWRGVSGAQRIVGHRDRPENLDVASPLVLPFHGSALARAVNPTILRRSVDAWRASPVRVLWTFTPVTYGLHELADRAIYHSVDLMHEAPRHYASAILAGERQLALGGFSAIASSTVVAQHLEDVGFEHVDVWENVADVHLFGDAARRNTRRPSLVVFAGNMTPHKVDLELLRRVAELPGCDLHVAGPTAIDGSDAPEIERLRGAGATFHGALGPRDLADLLAQAAVGLIPYRQNGYTAGVFPMKLYEYLSAGAAVVSTALPSLAGHASPDVIIARSGDEFLRTVEENLRVPDDATLRRRQHAASQASWEARGAAARDTVEGLFAPVSTELLGVGAL